VKYHANERDDFAIMKADFAKDSRDIGSGTLE
jgi:hypothetical protein